VERYKNEEALASLSEQDKHDLSESIAPLVHMDDADEYAKRFDNHLYGLILAQIASTSAFRKLKNQLCALCAALEHRATIPQVKEKLPLIRSVGSDEFWTSNDPVALETVRAELRDLIKFVVDEGTGRSPI